MKKTNIKLKGKLRRYLNWPLYLTIVLILMDIAMYAQDIQMGAEFSGFIVLYVIIVLISNRRSRPLLINELVNFATQYGTVQKQLLNDFEIPYALLDYNSRFLWMNEKFTEITGKDKNYHKSVTTVFPSLTKDILQKSEAVESINVMLDDRNYRISMKRIYFDSVTKDSAIVAINDTDEYLTAIYLFDETELNRYIRENEEQKLVAGLIYIDNYEEALDSIEDVKRSLLIALVDRKVNKYFTEIDALVRKIEKDKYFVVFKYKYLEQLSADKFKLIEDVKSIKVGNEMAITLSIGVGAGGVSYTQNYEYARMGIDLALGRGGDQVVVKEGEEVTYYGGKAKQVERNTRVKARVKAHALREIIESREHVVIMGHTISDVDSLGAAIGVYCAARVLGKKAQIVLNEVTTSLRPLVECFTEEKGYPADLFIKNEEALLITNKNTLVMVVDTNRPSYTECPELLKRTDTICVFDHHRQNSEVIENPVLSYIEPYASSACEMIAEVLQYFSENIKLEPSEADCIYAGILIDTNNFMTKTGVRTFEAAAYLRRAGAEVTRVRKMLRNDMAAYKARAEAVRHAEVYRGAFAISVCPADNIESPTIVGAQAANELLNIVGIKASFVLTEYQGKIYISSRSIDEINVQLIMERVGGGGHLNVAGAQLTNCTIQEAKRMIQDTIDEMIKEGDIQE
ncbi:DHH family phosphoesterase [Roseburia inulinivorans]|uniref:Cyclic-di-AMP phosphodiesterase n=1 Tax=Roseburia inulinivorans TaxID=360807 RepID=A0A396AFM8_9FIRM|nr:MULTISPECIES: DHH family phosphoesterase [Roseburia]RHD03510.1 DHH family phosphoesterase [Roseburia inulinivorans]RHF82725.1 DHH family phosphoesterase [Roseburia inulinivorans]